MGRTADEHRKSDGQLLKAATEGDELAFWEFCVQSLPTILRVLRAQCHRLGLPTDLVQDGAHETMVRAVSWLRASGQTDLLGLAD